MKIIHEPDLAGAVILKPAEMNKIHFGGNNTPLTPQQIRAMAQNGKAGRGRGSLDSLPEPHL